MRWRPSRQLQRKQSVTARPSTFRDMQERLSHAFIPVIQTLTISFVQSIKCLEKEICQSGAVCRTLIILGALSDHRPPLPLMAVQGMIR